MCNLRCLIVLIYTIKKNAKVYKPFSETVKKNYLCDVLTIKLGKNWGTATYVFMQIKWERKYG